MKAFFVQRFAARPLVYYAGLYAGTAAALKLAGFGLFLWLARTLTVSEYGGWGLYYALQTGIITFGLVGIAEAVIGLWRDRRDAGGPAALFAGANMVFVFTSAVTAIGAVLLAWGLVPTPGYSWATLLAVLVSGTMLAFASLQAQVLRLEEKHAGALVFNFLVPLAGLTGGGLAFAANHSVGAFFWGTAAGLALALAASRIAGTGCYALARDPAQWRPILQRLAPFLGITLLGWVGGYGNTYIIQSFFNETEVAKFTLLFMLAAVLQLVASAMNQVWAPRFYRLTHELPVAEVEVHSGRFLWWQGIALGVAGGVLVAVFPWVTQSMGGNLSHYGALGGELLMLVLYYVISVPWWHCQNYFLAHDAGRVMIRMNVAVSVAGLAVLGLAMWRWGAWGFYGGFLAQMVIRSAGALVVARRRWAVRGGFGGMLVGTLLALGGFALSFAGPAPN